MQMNALRSRYFAKLSSSSATSEGYCEASISVGMPGGYCLSQMRSMRLPQSSNGRGRAGRFGTIVTLPGDVSPLAAGHKPLHSDAVVSAVRFLPAFGRPARTRRRAFGADG